MAHTRNAERSEVTRSLLMSVARELFTERGFADAPTEELVRRAGLTRGALYHHFKDKEDLFVAVFEEIERELAERAAMAGLAQPDFAQGLLAGCEAFLDACLEPDVQRIALLDAPSVLGWERWRQVDECYGLGLITQAVSAAMADGLIEEQPAEPLAHLLMGALNEGAMMIARSKNVRKTRTEVGATIARLLDGLRTPTPDRS